MYYIGIELHKQDLVMAVEDARGPIGRPRRLSCRDVAAILAAVERWRPFRATGGEIAKTAVGGRRPATGIQEPACRIRRPRLASRGPRLAAAFACGRRKVYQSAAGTICQ